MKEEHRDIEDFFEQLKRQDTELKVPDFQTLYTPAPAPARPFWLVAAAVIAVLLGTIWWPTDQPIEEQPVVVVVSLENEENNRDDWWQEPETMEQWTAASDILIQEFEN